VSQVPHVRHRQGAATRCRPEGRVVIALQLAPLPFVAVLLLAFVAIAVIALLTDWDT
jgi:hypothetical protein